MKKGSQTGGATVPFRLRNVATIVCRWSRVRGAPLNLFYFFRLRNVGTVVRQLSRVRDAAREFFLRVPLHPTSGVRRDAPADRPPFITLLIQRDC